MPWTPAQIRLFQAAAHNPEIARRKGISQEEARRMAAEGVKTKTRKKRLVQHLRGEVD